VGFVRLGQPTSAYLDANAIIRFVEGDDDGLLFLLENAAADLLQLYTSEFTLSEVLVGPLKQNEPDLIDLYEDFVTSDEFLTVVVVDRTVLRRSAEIRATLGNKGPDAIHVATAVSSGCTIFISSDERIKLPPELRQIRIDDVHNLDEWR
jgi:predicted nucleic acid-binding protein